MDRIDAPFDRRGHVESYATPIGQHELTGAQSRNSTGQGHDEGVFGRMRHIDHDGGPHLDGGQIRERIANENDFIFREAGHKRHPRGCPMWP